MENPSQTQPPSLAAPEPHSGLGIASFIVAMLSLAVLGEGIIDAAMVAIKLGPNHDPHDPRFAFAGLTIMLGLAGDGLAFALGVASLFIAGRKKLFGILSVAFTVSMGGLVVLLMLIGLLARIVHRTN